MNIPTETEANEWLTTLLEQMGIFPAVVTYSTSERAFDIVDIDGQSYRVTPMLAIERTA